MVVSSPGIDNGNMRSYKNGSWEEVSHRTLAICRKAILCSTVGLADP
jgi:hypothetical protein